MTRFNVFDINWDTDGETVDLPATMVVEVDSEDDIADAISDATGFCHNSFNCTEIQGV